MKLEVITDSCDDAWLVCKYQKKTLVGQIFQPIFKNLITSLLSIIVHFGNHCTKWLKTIKAYR